MKRIVIAAMAMLSILLAACAGNEGTESAEPTPEPTPEATATPSEEPATEVSPSLAEGAGELADVLPEEVGGISIQYQSSSGEAVLGSEGMTPETQEVFDRLGAEPSDLSSAFGFGVDATAGSVISIVAFRVSGADEGQLRDEFIATFEQQGQTGTEQSLGGKDVLAFSAEGTTGSGFLYVHGDTVFIVAGEPVALAEEALAALP